MRLTTGKIQVYTGNGKGKTTASLGLCFRAAGHGLRVCVIQFIKKQWCGEHVSAQALGIEILQGGLPDVRLAVQEQLKEAWLRINAETCDVLVLDEIFGSLHRGYVELADVLSLMDAKPEHMELVLTGRNAPPEVLSKADLITSMECVKHYYNAGLAAREGIEY
jgi:cob(I)alamin adenosyltransferase